MTFKCYTPFPYSAKNSSIPAPFEHPFSKNSNKTMNSTVQIFRNEMAQKYSELAKISIEKKYNILNLNPFSFSSRVDKIEKQIIKLEIPKHKKRQIKTELSEEKQHSNRISKKISQFIKNAREKTIKEAGSPLKKKYKLQMKSREFLGNKKKQFQTKFLDDHQTIMHEFEEQKKNDIKIRQDTFSKINGKLIEKYSNRIQPLNINKKNNNQIVKFKKPQRVTYKYEVQQNQETSNPNLKLKRKANSTYSTDKYDIGVYSRSANKALYYKTQDSDDENEAKVQPRTNKVQRLYYQNYIQSYKYRKQLLNSASTFIN